MLEYVTVEVGLRESDASKDKKVERFIKSAEKKIMNELFRRCITVDNVGRIVNHCKKVSGHELALVDEDTVWTGNAEVIGYVEVNAFDKILWMDVNREYVGEEYIKHEILRYLKEEYEELIIKFNKLKTLREKNGITQEKLAELSGVNLKSIQAYEQGEKDINKAQGVTLYNLSKVLKCGIEDLLDF